MLDLLVINMSNIHFIGNKVYNDDRLIGEYDFPILKIIDFENSRSIVICLSIPVRTIYNENVLGINYEGKTIWKVPKSDYLYEESPFVDIQKWTDNESYVKLINWDSSQMIIDPSNGSIVITKEVLNKGKRPW